MSWEVHVQFCERAGVRFPCATHLIITGDSKELLENEVRPVVEQFLKERGLTLSADKTRITHINEGFDFLGQNLRKYDGKPLVKPSKKNTHAFLEKVRGIIDANKSVSQTLLIGLLNPVIRGWANYHRHCAAKETFKRIDHEIWRALWQWVNERRMANRFGCALCMRAKPKFGGISKSGGTPTRLTHNGNPTSRNVRSSRSSAFTANTRGSNRRECRLRSRGALHRLEPDEAKVSRPVLRGARGGNVARLPDRSDVPIEICYLEFK
jgi:hypothetical protein